MKEPPAFLPKANSRKWHGAFNSLGYYRVRTLANPQAPREPYKLIRWLRLESGSGDPELKRLRDAAIREIQRYNHLQPGADSDEAWQARLDAQWDAMLVTFDAYLEANHRYWQARRE